MTAPSNPLDAGLQIAEALENAGIPYALGGALAYGVWAIPRATMDVDVNVFLPEDGLDPLLAALSPLGIAVDPEQVRAQAAREGMFVARYGPFRLDVFLPSIDFSWEAERTRRRVDIQGRPAWFLSAEALAVFKLLFFRGKDIVDLERLISTCGASLDAGWVRGHIAALMGEDDERVATWDRLVREHGPGA